MPDDDLHILREVITMAALAKQIVAQSGIAITFTAAGGTGDTVPCEEGTILLVNNGSASPITVTIATPATSSGLAIADEVVTVAAGAIEAIGPFGADFVDATDGRAHVTYSATTTVTVACLHTP